MDEGLLPKPCKNGVGMEEEDGVMRKLESAVVKWAGEVKAEGWKTGCIAGPMMVVTLSMYGLQVISIIMVGRLGELPLSSTAIATSLTGVTGFSFLVGMASGLDTLCGQAYGAKQYQKLSILLYRAIFSLYMVCLPITALWLSLGHLLTLIGQDPLISLEAGKYAMWMIPALFAYATAQPLMKFLQSQSLTLPMLLSSTITLCVHVPLSWFLVFKSGLHHRGAALSTGISYWLNVMLLGLYIRFSPSCKAVRSPISMEAFRGTGEFFRIAIPSAVMICLEWWSFELVILLSGMLPNPELETSVLSICLTSMAMLNSIPFGLGAAASTRVSNQLGAGNPQGARFSVQVIMSLTVAHAIILGSIIFALRDVAGYAYSNEKEIINYVTEMVPLVCISIMFAAIQEVLSGIARGCGWQHIGAYVNLGAFYLTGIPLAVVMGFLLHIGGKGLWIGVLIGAAVQIIILALVTGFTNWQQQANKARERMFEGRLPLDNGLK